MKDPLTVHLPHCRTQSSSPLAFSLLGSAHQVFDLHVLRSCASSLCTPVSFTSFCITIAPPQFWSSYLSMSTHVHLLITITTSSSVFLSTGANHLSLPSSHYYIFFSLSLHRCQPSQSSIFSLLHLLQSFSPQVPTISVFHLLITTSSSVFLSTGANHLSLASLIFSLMFATPAIALFYSILIFLILFIPIIHLNILISVGILSSKFCS